jgi:hypothetical protein
MELSKGIAREVPEKITISDKERYLLKALLYLLLYSGMSDMSEENGKLKSLLVSGQTQPTDFGRPKTMIAG